MKIKFSSSCIKITFEEGEAFSNRLLLMNGEALENGFDADASTMKWLPPFDSEAIDEKTKNRIKQLITIRNETHSFKVLFMGEGNYV